MSERIYMGGQACCPHLTPRRCTEAALSEYGDGLFGLSSNGQTQEDQPASWAFVFGAASYAVSHNNGLFPECWDRAVGNAGLDASSLWENLPEESREAAVLRSAFEHYRADRDLADDGFLSRMLAASNPETLEGYLEPLL